MENEKIILRWGGLAGILAFVVFIVDIPIYAFIDPASSPLFAPEGLMRFSDVRVALGISTILMMMFAIFSIALILALYRALRGANMAFALFGGVLGIIGYIVNALGDASTFIALAPISDLSQADVATPETQATVALLWQATRGITITFFFVGSLFLAMCFIVLGVAMLRAPAFGRRFGGVSIALGVIGILGVVASLFVSGESGAPIIGLAAFAGLIFLPLFGWKVYSLSRAT